MSNSIQNTNIFSSTTSLQHHKLGFCNATAKSCACSATSNIFLEICGHMSDSISFVIWLAVPKGKPLRFVFVHDLSFNELIYIQFGLEPCGFCGGEGCATKLDQKRNGHPSIISSCRYVFASFNYEQAKLSTKTSPCTNIPIPCPFCHSSGREHFVWKYNVVAHIATQHPEGIISFDLLSQMHISLREAEFMKVDLEGMKLYRKTHDLLGSDDLVEPEATIGEKRARASSTSSICGSRKSSRYQ